MTKRIKTFLYSIAFTSVAAVALSAAPVPKTMISHSIFGGTYGKADCLARAQATINGYLQLHGGLGLSPAKGDNWFVVGWNIDPGSVDVIFTCADAVAKDSIGNAYVSLHATGERASENVTIARERLVKIWGLMK